MKSVVFNIAQSVALTCALITAVAAAELNYRSQPVSVDSNEWSLQVPEGYVLEYLYPAPGARMISFAPNGDMFVGSRRDVVYMSKPPYDEAIDYLELNGYPHSVAVREDKFIVATTDAVLITDYDPEAERLVAGKLELLARLPGGFGHSSRTLKIGPDGSIYVSLGIRGNCSDEFISPKYRFDRRRGGVMRLNEEISPPTFEAYAVGLRNPVGFDWHPVTGDMFASNNGPDHWGFDLPPEYFSKLAAGSNHGMPWFQFDGETLQADPCITTRPPFKPSDVELPVATFPARNAPLGMTFVPSSAMDSNFQLNAIVALHGSWATLPDGLISGESSSRRPPAVVMVRFEDGKAKDVVDVISGFQSEDGQRLARPADVAVGPDGMLYITSDGGIVHGLLRLTKLEN